LALAAAGVDQRVIDAFVDHQTEEAAWRYQHLRPDKLKNALLAPERRGTDGMRQSRSSPGAECEAHFFIAMTKLAEGNRIEAKAPFREARETQITFLVDSLACELSRAFLSQREDPAWHPWIGAGRKP
jgi:hypothetical protein